MSLKKWHYDRGDELCYTCMYIDEYVCNVAENGEVPHGYDGIAICCKYNKDKKKSNDNRFSVSPTWKACKQYRRCTERQARYLDIYDKKSDSVVPNPFDISKVEQD